MADFDSAYIKRRFTAAAGRRAAGFAGGSTRGAGMIFVVSGLEDKGLLQDGRGRFVGAGIQSDLAAAHRRLALELAQAIVEAQVQSTRRPGVSTGRLAAALLDPQNRYSDTFGFGVGDAEFLDRSDAKYWRQIDQGFTGHVGREIYGVWGESLTGSWRTPQSGGSPYPVAGPAFTAFGANRSGRLLPTRKSNQARNMIRRGAGAGSRKARNRFSAATKGVISKPIEPQEYFRRGWEDFNVKGRYMATVREIISRNFGGQGIPTGPYLRFLEGKPGAKLPAPSRQFR